ncbi:MAG: anthranilate phosphoribosyltransferase [Pirellulaceae bacterium]|nr:anthranilate phosphoribosyltransferase [Pirellulaceae bacterium]
MLTKGIEKLKGGLDLSRSEMGAIIGQMMSGVASETEMGSFLLALREKGETVEELAGAAEVLRANMIPIQHSIAGAVDTCGTGGDHSGTFNISTAAALVTAGAGVPVAKHGNRSITSKSGSADVLAELGVGIEASLEVVGKSLEEVGICFCFAPQLHPSMRHVGPVRRSLGVPTIFNMLGPLCNPASAPFQVLGVANEDAHEKIAKALHLLGTERAVVVRGKDGLDEVTIETETDVYLLEGESFSKTIWSPQDFGILASSKESLKVESARESAAVIRQVLSGEKGPARDIVVVNAAAAIWLAERATSLEDGAKLAAEAIDSGAATEILEKLIEKTV